MTFEHGANRTPFGIALHTTGNGIPEQAARSGKPPLEVARAVYGALGLVGPHYVIDPLGAVDQYADPAVIRYHVGLEPEHRRSFLDGHWLEDRNRIPAAVVAWWQQRWPGVKSPSHLYPGKSANSVYIGIELVPCGRYVIKPGLHGTTWAFEHGTKPGFDKQRFSVEQYTALARLCVELAATYRLNLAKPGVLVGHEDLNPYTRPGWDPGDMTQTFSWALLKGFLAAVQR